MRPLPLFVILALPACDVTLAPDPPAALPYDAQSFAVSGNHTMVLTSTGVESVGSDVPLPTDENGDPIALDVPPSTAIAVGHRHACVVSVTGTVHCWGDQSDGALGPRACNPPQADGGAPDCILGPAIVPSLPPTRAIAAGDDVTCAIISDGDRVVCWGAASRVGGSELPALDPPIPVRLSDGTLLAATRVVIDHGSVCAIDHDAELWCWGDGFGAKPQHQPQHGVVDIAIGTRHRCIIDDTGLSCLGDDRNGEVGDTELARRCNSDQECRIDEPLHIDLDATRVVVGERHTCALTRDSQVWCWGSNEVGQLGRSDAFLVGDKGIALTGVSDLAAGFAHTCAQRGIEVWCWGSTAATGGQP